MEKPQLASFDTDGWQLADAVFRHEQYPESFEIPDESVRTSLGAGDLVKLIFEYQLTGVQDDSATAERMWVEVTDRVDPFYIGSLANEPYVAQAQHKLVLGSRVVFLPDNIVNVDLAAS